jgi:hypothetical protein
MTYNGYQVLDIVPNAAGVITIAVLANWATRYKISVYEGKKIDS